MVFQFIHPTKVGGSAVFDYLQNFYPNSFQYFCHSKTCENSQYPIIILRDPFDRFLSMYFYWKNGSEKNFEIKRKNFSLDQFIQFLRHNPQLLHNHYFWKDHYTSLSHWIPPSSYSKTVVILYDKNNMQQKIQNLLTYLELPLIHKSLEKKNVSKKDQHITLNESQKNFVQSYFKSDFELFRKIIHQPQLFKKII
jgi:hypothetical protein